MQEVPESSPAANEPLTICVYMASRHGDRPDYAADATATGRALSAQKCDLVYGGGSVGLMGDVADVMLAEGSSVTGIITQQLFDLEVGHTGITELVVVSDMPTRKRAMFDRADGFIVLPGGVGTMEELFEVWCWASLGLHPKSIGLLNTDGYYDHLLAFLQRSVEDGLMTKSASDLLIVDHDPQALVDRVVAEARREALAA